MMHYRVVNKSKKFGKAVIVETDGDENQASYFIWPNGRHCLF